MLRRTTTLMLVAVLGTALAASPALAGKKKRHDPKPPTVRSTEYQLAEQPGAVQIGATVARAEKVVAVIGAAGTSHRLNMTPADGSRTTLWVAQETRGLETCLPVKFVATNDGGVDIYREDSCVFGLPNPLPPTPTLPFIGLG